MCLENCWLKHCRQQVMPTSKKAS
ncbi:UNVERIFIED_CONTAM: hypothetical protein GTU68_027255 [Idotea baltica]|nr:hypothetical protein [Idotea baltica]